MVTATPPTTDSAPPPVRRSTASETVARLGRLTLKELREILRDRRTIVTLVLMPLLVYPLLSIGFRQFFLSRMVLEQPTSYRIGVESEAAAQWLRMYLHNFAPLETKPVVESTGEKPISPEPTWFVVEDLEAAVKSGGVDLGVRLRDFDAVRLARQSTLAVDAEFLVASDYAMGDKALASIERRMMRANTAFLDQRLQAMGLTQRATPVAASRVEIETGEKRSSVSLLTVLPLILIMMTITGAVYPAIDLTAGERERGTLEILVAAPVPRLGLLLAKYVSVLTVAMLTATVNLATMAITIAASGMGPLLFGEQGWRPLAVVQIFALLLLFAAFFSAVLLSLTSFARSFKEAQAYLIPLMLASLAPGLLAMTPGLRLTGLLAVAPLVNIVLLGRELLEQTAELPAAVIVVTTTFLYALAALSVAARVFGSEDVLFNTQSGWSDALRRSPRPREAPSIASALMCLALIFPAFFLTTSALGQLSAVELSIRLLLSGAATCLLFGGFPWLAAWFGRDRLREAFQLHRPHWVAWPAAVLLGLSLWPLAHEIVVWQRELGLFTLSDEQLERVRSMLAAWRQIPLGLILLSMAVAPGVFEELFFRGYLMRALREHGTALSTIGVSALLFGLFHLVTTDSLAIERLLPSTLLGVVLGWLCWRTGSVLPGMLLHTLHNGFLVSVAYYQPWLEARGIGMSDESHLPAAWLAASALVSVAAAAMVWLGTRRKTELATGQ
jgi:ABC-2 type transport system permease protein/sodium transport system permease protein